MWPRWRRVVMQTSLDLQAQRKALTQGSWLAIGPSVYFQLMRAESWVEKPLKDGSATILMKDFCIDGQDK